MAEVSRQVAVKLFVSELLSGRYEQKEGWEPNILHCARGEVSRVNILGTLVRVGSDVSLDDGTGRILLRSYEEYPGSSISDGSVVQVIGRPREYAGSLFVVPEIVSSVDVMWAQVRKVELGSVLAQPEPVLEPVELVSESDNLAEKIVDVISELDDGSGVLIDDVLERINREDVISQLLLDGEIFEIKPGVLKVL